MGWLRRNRQAGDDSDHALERRVTDLLAAARLAGLGTPTPLTTGPSDR